MDSSIKNEKKLINYENRWNRIEKKHINSIKLGHRNNATNAIYKNILKTKSFVNDRQMKMMMGAELPKEWCLDPNLVMDLRHENVNKRKSKENTDWVSEKRGAETNLVSGGNANTGVVYEDKDYFHRMQFLNEEIEKFRNKIEAMRPKPSISDAKKNTHCSKYNGIKDFDCDKIASNIKQKYTLNGIKNGYNSEYKLDIVLGGGDNEESLDLLDDQNFDRRFENNIEKISQKYTELERIYNYEVDATDHGEKFAATDKSDSRSLNVDRKMKVTLVPKPKEKEKNCDFELIITPAFCPLELDDVAESPCEAIPIPKQNLYVAETIIKKPKRKQLFSPGQSIVVSKIEVPNLNPDQSAECGLQNVDFNVNAVEKSAIISELFIEQTDRAILKKYFIKWFRYNTIMKLTKQNTSQCRVKKIEAFLNNLTVERRKELERLKANALKSKQNSTNCETKTRHMNVENPELLARKYNNKLKIQQDIIELQKIKLQRQQRIITEMKLSKLMEEAGESQANVKQELKQVIRTGCPNSRSKARCLQVVSNLKDLQDDTEHTEIQARGLRAPKFLIEMQARTMEREMKHRQAKERREYLDWEKEQIRLAAEDAKRLQDEEAKRKRIDELRRKRREEKQLRIQRELDRQKHLEDLERSKQFYRIKFLKFVFNGFRRLIEMKRQNERLSSDFNCRLIKQKHFRIWRDRVRKIWIERKAKADDLHKKICLRASMSRWHEYYLTERSKKLVAADWYDMKLSERALRIWSCLTAQTRLMFDIKTKQAELHYEWNLKWKVLDHWRRLHAILRIERETEMRRQKWRNKISEILPDYNPNRDNLDIEYNDLNFK